MILTEDFMYPSIYRRDDREDQKTCSAKIIEFKKLKLYVLLRCLFQLMNNKTVFLLFCFSKLLKTEAIIFHQ